MTDLVLDAIADAGVLRFVELCCSVGGVPLEGWRSLPIRTDVEVIALTVVAERLRRARRRVDAATPPRSDAHWWKLAAERLGLSTEEAHRVRLNRATRRNAGRLANFTRILPSALVPGCPSGVRDPT